MKQNERTRRMIKSFMRLHNQGLSIADIAAKYHLSTSTVYACLDEIAKKANVTRESLLQKIQPSRYVPGSIHAKTPVLPEGEFRSVVLDAMTAIGKVQDDMKSNLNSIEIFSRSHKEVLK